MLVLLIMLIITIRSSALGELNMPVGNPAAAAAIVVQVDVDFDGTIYWDAQAL